MTPVYIGSLRTEELEQLISPCGFYKAKARTIHALITWYRCYPSAANVIYNLRKKIEPDSKNPTYIKTVLGVCYKFNG